MVSLTPNPSYSVTLRIKLPNQVSQLAAVIEAIAQALIYQATKRHLTEIQFDRLRMLSDIIVEQICEAEQKEPSFPA